MQEKDRIEEDSASSDSFKANSNLNKEGMHNVKDGTAKIHQDSNINCETETENKEVGTNFALNSMCQKGNPNLEVITVLHFSFLSTINRESC